ncbi:hypothetical protein Leryth_000405 [Lithospermum erythrorhizon]|nr:hypothetical protein Leryth_000405 [Lithospermum erythrorhizon]
MESTEMLSREQLINLFDRFSELTSQPDVKKRIADAVNDNQEAVAVTTTIQEEIFLEMGVDPIFGLASLGKINMAFDKDQDLMIRFYGFVAKEELACEEAELGPEKFAERLVALENLHQKQSEMLQYMRNFGIDDQSAILEKLRQQMENENFEGESSLLSAEQMQEIVKRRVSPLFQPR